MQSFKEIYDQASAQLSQAEAVVAKSRAALTRLGEMIGVTGSQRANGKANGSASTSRPARAGAQAPATRARGRPPNPPTPLTERVLAAIPNGRTMTAEQIYALRPLRETPNNQLGLALKRLATRGNLVHDETAGTWSRVAPPEAEAAA